MTLVSGPGVPHYEFSVETRPACIHETMALRRPTRKSLRAGMSGRTLQRRRISGHYHATSRAGRAEEVQLNRTLKGFLKLRCRPAWRCGLKHGARIQQCLHQHGAFKAKPSADLLTWLGSQANIIASKQKITLLEVYCGKSSRLTQVFEDEGMHCIRVGLELDRNLLRMKDKRCLLELLDLTRPLHVHVVFPCYGLGSLNRSNMSPRRSLKCRTTARRSRMICCRRLRFTEKILAKCQNLQLGFSAENPCSSDAWKLCRPLRQLETTIFDQCMYGLFRPDGRRRHRKRTRVCSNRRAALHFLGTKCDGNHAHARLEGSWGGMSLTRRAEHYP